MRDERDRWTDATDDWLDDEDDHPRRDRRSRRLLLLAGLPWLVVLAVLLLPAHDAGPAPPSAAPDTGPAGEVAGHEHLAEHGTPTERPADPDPAEDVAGGAAAAAPADGTGATTAVPPAEATTRHDDAPDDAPTDDVSTAVGASDDLWVVEHRGSWRRSAGTEEAAALGVVVARAWLTDLDPRLAIGELRAAGAGRYVEHLVVEAVEVPLEHHAVVTLLAVLLVAEDDGADELTAEVRRLAVPIAFDDDGARPGGSPWWLPGPSLEPRPPATTVIEEPEELLAAAEALAAAGFTEVSLERLERTEGPVVLAAVTARTPEDEPVDGTVWLRRHVDRYVVAGTVLARSEAADGEVTP